MTRLKKILFSSLTLSAHYRFCASVSEEIAGSPSVVIKSLGELPTTFNAWLAEEKALEDWVRRSFLTEQIVGAGRKLGRAVTAIKIWTRSGKYSPDTNIVEAAERVYIMLKGYGDINKKTYEQKAGDATSILRQLTDGGDYAADASILGMGLQIGDLRNTVAHFEQLITQRDEKRLRKPDKTFKRIRSGIEPAYHRIEEVINAGALTSYSPASFTTFINHLNPEIERLNDEFHRIRHDIARAELLPIALQHYTGLALTPVPKVFHTTTHDGTVQLELGKDYNVTYKNNINAGNAECTIHGKGAYKGSKTTTFMIAR